MVDPTPEQWERILDIIEEVSELDLEAREERLKGFQEEMELQGEEAGLLDFVRLQFQLPNDPNERMEGRVIGTHFTVVEKIGEGGMGVVYRARDTVVGREVALKMIQPGILDPQWLNRFDSEIRVLGQLEHPGIVTLFEAGWHPDQEHPKRTLYFAMRLVEGQVLNRYVREQGMGETEILRLFLKVCEAVQYAHDHGIIHRDLKPTNILVGRNGNPGATHVYRGKKRTKKRVLKIYENI